MKNIVLGILSIIVFAVHSGIAHAEPVLKPRIQGSTFLVEASNPENTGYNCNISYTLNYSDFGKPGSEDFKRTTYVSSNSSGGVVLRQDTAWASSTLGFDNFSSSCFKASTSSQTSTPTRSHPLPGGTYQESCGACSFNGSLLVCSCDGKHTSLAVDVCGAGRNQICNNQGRLSCPGPC